MLISYFNFTICTIHVVRFLFPDSPTTAYFLTLEERVQAIQRIKVNQAGVENKYWKREQSEFNKAYYLMMF